MSSLAGMRIGVVTPRLEAVGGTEIYVRRLLDLQGELGATVQAFTAADTELGESIHPLRRPDARAVADSADRIAASCDFVEFHGCAPLPLLRALAGRVPVILYQHTSELTCPAGGRFLPASGQICHRAPGLGCVAVDASQQCLTGPDGTRFPWTQRLKTALRLRLSREALHLASAVVTNSQALNGLLRSTLGFSGHSVVIPPMLPARASQAVHRTANRILFCGRLAEFKGILDAVQVCAGLADTELVVVGSGPAEPAARALVAELGAASRVSFRGWLADSDVQLEMAQASVLLVPTRGFEAWCMSGPEAVAEGCAVVAWDVGGIGEWCRKPWGTLAPAADRDALARGVAQRLAAPPSESERMDWKAAALENWGPSTFARRYLEFVATIPIGRL